MAHPGPSNNPTDIILTVALLNINCIVVPSSKSILCHRDKAGSVYDGWHAQRDPNLFFFFPIKYYLVI
jgi:hypothetical protein